MDESNARVESDSGKEVRGNSTPAVSAASGTASSDMDLRKREERKKGSTVRGCARNFMKIRFWGVVTTVRQMRESDLSE